MSTWALGNWQAFVTIFWIFGDFLFRIIGWNKQTNKKNNNERKVGLLSASQPYYILKNIFSSFWQATKQRFSCPPYQIAYLCPVKLPLCLLISGTYLNGWAVFFFLVKKTPRTLASSERHDYHLSETAQSNIACLAHISRKTRWTLWVNYKDITSIYAQCSTNKP